MLAVEEMVLNENKMLRDEGRKIGISEGKKIGISEGKIIGINRVAKEMLKNGVDDKYVEKYTHLSKEKIEKLKAEILKI